LDLGHLTPDLQASLVDEEVEAASQGTRTVGSEVIGQHSMSVAEVSAALSQEMPPRRSSGGGSGRLTDTATSVLREDLSRSAHNTRSLSASLVEDLPASRSAVLVQDSFTGEQIQVGAMQQWLR
jgi:hypothetical protein